MARFITSVGASSAGRNESPSKHLMTIAMARLPKGYPPNHDAMRAPTNSPKAPSMSTICAGHSCARTQCQIWRRSLARRGRSIYAIAGSGAEGVRVKQANAGSIAGRGAALGSLFRNGRTC
jgi:hypothetical protein